MFPGKTMPADHALILDERYTAALLSKLCREGFLKKPRRAKTTHAPKKEQRVLQSLLLYDKLYLAHDSCTDFDLDPLEQENLAEVIPNPPSILARFSSDAWTEYLEMFFAYTQDGQFFEPHDNFWRLFSPDDQETLRLLERVWDSSVRARNLKTLRFGADSKSFATAIRLIWDSGYRLDYLDYVSEMPKEKYLQTMWWVYYHCATVWEENLHYQSLITQSGAHSAPVLNSRLRLPRQPAKADKDGLMESDQSYWQAFGVYLEEVAFLPRLTTIQDAIRLRSDKRIKAFRETLNAWSSVLRDGDINAEKRLRKEIQKANRSIERMTQAQHVGKWITYLSIPVTVASLVSGVPFGITLFPLGVAIRLCSDVSLAKNGWMMVGRQ